MLAVHKHELLSYIDTKYWAAMQILFYSLQMPRLKRSSLSVCLSEQRNDTIFHFSDLFVYLIADKIKLFQANS